MPRWLGKVGQPRRSFKPAASGGSQLLAGLVIRTSIFGIWGGFVAQTSYISGADRGSGTFKWTPNATTGLIENRGKTFDARQGVACLSSQHPATAPVLAFEYKSAGHSAAFVQNRGGTANVSYAGSQLALAGGSISFILDGRELFNTEAVAPVTECNRSRTPIGQPLSWDSWAEPLPPTGGEAVRSATPMEQLSLTNDQTDYMFYTAQLPPQMEWDGTAAQINLTIGSIESNAFLLFLDGKFIGSANDHTKGPNHLTLSVPVASETASQAKVLTLLSASMGIQNFHGDSPARCISCGLSAVP